MYNPTVGTGIRVLVALTFGVLGGCADPEEDAAAPNQGSTWTLSAEPLVRIGGNDDSEGHQLTHVLAALRLSDGRIVVADQTSRELRYFDAAGQHTRTDGGPGTGPGQLNRISVVTRFGDSIAVWDGSERKLSVFPPAMTQARVYTLASLPAPLARLQAERRQGGALHTFIIGVNVYAMSGGATFLIPRIEPFTDALPMTPTVVQDTLPLLFGSTNGEVTAEIGRYPGQEYFYNGRIGMLRPLGGRIAAATQDTLAYYSVPAEGTIHVFSSRSGQLLRRIELPAGTRRAPAERDLAPARERLAAMTILPPGYVDEVIWPETLPVVSDLRVGSDGLLWVQLYASPTDTLKRVLAYEPNGRLVGSIALGMEDSLLDAGPDYALVLNVGELEVEEVRLYQLVRDSGQN